METSYKFSKIEENLVKLLDTLLQNEDLKKYIRHLTDNPLLEANVTEDLIEDGYVVLTPFNEEILNEQKVTMFINPVEGNLRNQPLSDLKFRVDLVVPIKKWILRGLGQIRIFRIADIISQLVDQQKIMGMKDNAVTNFSMYKVNKEYGGLSLLITVNSSTMKGLR